MTGGVEAPEHACPACGRPAVYAQSEDRFFHRDGSDNDPCWLALLRGQRVPSAGTGTAPSLTTKKEKSR